MAFSMLVRNSACTSRMFSQQVMRLATQPLLLQKTNSAALTNLTIKTNNSALLNAVRTFRTSPIRQAAEKTHDHSKLWVIERITSAALVPLLPIALLMPNKLFDSLLAVLITAHSFWGLEAIAVDYVRAAIFGPVIPKVAIALVYLISIATLGGLFYVISHDIGIANSVRKFWALKSETA